MPCRLRAVFLSLSLLVMACGGGEDLVSGQSPSDVDVLDGVGVPAVPIELGVSSAVASAPSSHVFAMPATHRGKAALLDVATGLWRVTAPVPFEDALFNPVAVWTGEAYLVLGNRCTTYSDNGGALPVCEPGGLVAGLYFPASNDWVTVPAPQDDTEVVSLTAVGLLERTAYVRVESAVHAFDIDGETWQRLPDAPVQWDRLCVSDESIVAVGSTDQNAADVNRLDSGGSGELDTESASERPPITGAEFDPATGDWSEAFAAGDSRDAAQQFQAVCSWSGALMVPVGTPPADGLWNSYAFVAGQWVVQPAPPERLGAVSASVSSTDSVTLWTEVGQVALSSVSGELIWSTTRRTTYVAAAVPLDDDEAFLVEQLGSGEVVTTVASIAP